MKQAVKWAMFFILCLLGAKAHASCTGVTGGGAASVITNAVAACSTAGGGTVTIGAGTYGPFTSQFTLPCSVSLTGPTVAYQPTHYQTAILQGSSSFTGVPIHTTAGCGSMQNISYLEWNGEQASGSGGFIYISPSTTNLTINNNWMHGANGGAYPGNTSEAQIYFAGTNTNLSNPTTNVIINLNEFGPEGAASDCGAAMTETNTEGGGGYCAGILFNAYVKNPEVTNNIFHYLEQGAKIIETTTNGGSTQNSGNVQGLILSGNDFSQIQRIYFETQSNYYTTAFPTSMTISYNSMGNRYNGGGGQQNFELSIANGCGNPPATANCTATIFGNSDIQNVNNSSHSAGNELWGDSNTYFNNNLFEGYVAGAGGAIDFAQSGAFNLNGNIFNIFSGSGTNCVSTTGGYWNHEDSPASNPTCTGNTYSNTGTGTYTSQAPTITPSGSFTGTQTVSLMNTVASPNLNANTSFWYTTDGTTPVPGTSQFYTGPFSVTSTTTVKAVGMWGGINQPRSYPTSYGWVPSAVVSATYTTSGGGTINDGYLSTSPTNGVNTATTGGSTVQFIPIVDYVSGPTGVALSPSACTWTTLSGGTSVFSISSAGVLTPTYTGSGTGSDNVIATCSGVQLSEWTVTVSPLVAPTLTGLSISPFVVFLTGPTTLVAVGTYSDGSVSPTTSVWTSSNSSVATISSSTGLITPVGIGETLVQATAAGLIAKSTVVVPPNVLYPNPIANNFPNSNPNFGCFVFQNLAIGTYTLVVNADGSFTIH